MKFSLLSFLKSSNAYFTGALVLLIASVGYGVFQFQILRNEQAAILDGTRNISQFDRAIAASKQEFSRLSDARANGSNDHQKKIASILPEDESYTELTRALDNFFADHDRPGNPIFESSLRYGKGAPVAKMNGVSALPVSLNIEGTRDNFFKFLDFVDSSGSLENGARLMDVKSIQLNFPAEGEVTKDLQQIINFTVEMNAYYQTPRVTRQN